VILSSMKNLGEAVSKLLFKVNGKEAEQNNLDFSTKNVAVNVKVI